MLKEFADQQRERERNGFYEKHGLRATIPRRMEKEAPMSGESASRIARQQAMMPSYMKQDEGSKIEDGRREYLEKTDFGSKELTEYASCAYDKSGAAAPDYVELAKTDPEIRKQLYLRRQVKSQQVKPYSGRVNRGPSERRLALPPPKFDEVDEQVANDVHQKNMLIRDGHVKDMNGVPNGPLFRREQHVFLPKDTEWTLQQVAFGPIKQRKPNPAFETKFGEAPDLNSNLPVEFNQDITRHKPKPGTKAKLMQHPDYERTFTPRVDMEAPNFEPWRRQSTVQKDIVNPEVGNATDIYYEPINGHSPANIEERPIGYAPHDHLPHDPDYRKESNYRDFDMEQRDVRFREYDRDMADMERVKNRDVRGKQYRDRDHQVTRVCYSDICRMHLLSN